MGLQFDKRRDCEGKIPRWVAMVPKDCKIEHYSCGVLEKTCNGVHQCWANKIPQDGNSPSLPTCCESQNYEFQALLKCAEGTSMGRYPVCNGSCMSFQVVHRVIEGAAFTL